MLKYLRNNIGVPGHGGMIPKGLPGYDYSQTIGYRYDYERAKKLIEINNLKGAVIKVSVTADYVDLVKYVQSQLDQLGLEVRVEVMPTATLREMRAFGKLDVFRASWVADYPDGENYLSLFYHPNQSPAGPNYTHFNDKNFDRMFEASYEETDPQKRAEQYRQMDSMVMEQAPVVVLYYDEVLRFIHKNIKGLAGNPSNQLDLKRVYKQDLLAE
jgi:peptide/nickel transport system substrate-binding protein